jgi:N-acetylglucosaminyldiphosphoundecaprenol N-acetyl-beta-D-mannosaminyltransferase
MNSDRPSPRQSAGATFLSRADASDAAAPLLGDDLDRNVWSVLGVPIDVATIDGAVGKIDAAVSSRRPLSFVTPNVNWLVRACRDEGAREQIIAADLSLADGAPLAWIARRLSVPIRSRVAGSDVFEALRRRPGFVGRKISVFFFGGREGSAEQAAAAVEKEESGLTAAGWLNPGFGDLDEMSAPEIIDEINAAAPDFIVVALGAAKGQAWIDRNRDSLNAPVTAHLGAVVDFTSGKIKRAPRRLRRLGLEWAWRIKEEPALWVRYASDFVSLSRLIATRLAPLTLALRSQKTQGEAAADIDRRGSVARIALSGDHTRQSLSVARSAVRDLVDDQSDLVVDLTDLGRVDLAFVGFLLMLEKKIKSRGRQLFVTGANRVHNRILTANGIIGRAPGSEAEAARAEDLVAAAG